MTFAYELPLLVLLVLTALAAIAVKDLLGAVLLLGSYSFFLALVWAWLGAVDVAFVEAVVGAGLGTVFFLLTLIETTPADTSWTKLRGHVPGIVGVAALVVLLLFTASDLPRFGDPQAPASVTVSPEYLERSIEETRTPNVVASVLMDYRALDTLIETLVVFTSGIACWLLLRRTRT